VRQRDGRYEALVLELGSPPTPRQARLLELVVDIDDALGAVPLENGERRVELGRQRAEALAQLMPWARRGRR
jgi:hypothetical protein